MILWEESKVQILLKVATDLLEYRTQVNKRTFKFPSYKSCCPICHRSDCADWHGYYCRPAYTKDNQFIKDLPIRRGFCRKKKITFSLLPQQLIPYSKYPLKLITDILDIWVRAGKNIYRTMNNICHVGEQDEATDEMGNSHIYYFRRVFERAREKFILWRKEARSYKIEKFIRYCQMYRPQQSEGLSLEYYSNNGSYVKSSHFLFGTASQFRFKFR